MIIQHNMAAANTNRQLGIATGSLSKSTEKLSSGYRINRAADDAAGLSISEKMRGQIRGLDQASSNAQDGISLIQTAEGALTESHSILQRMRELSVQAANGTETDDDREAVQAEIEELQEELTRISETTEFNTMKLLDGSLAGPKGISVSGNTTIGAEVAKLKEASTTVVGLADAGSMADTDFVKEKIYIDGAEITVDWAKLSQEDKDALKVDWTNNSSVTVAKKAAEIMQNAINQAIDDSGLGVEHITVKNSGDKSFVLESGSKGVDSKIATLAADTNASVLAKSLTGFDGDTSAAGTTKYSGETINANDTFYAEINGQQLVVKVSAEIANGATMKTVASTLQTSINAAIGAYNTDVESTRSEDDKLKNVTVDVSKDGRLVIGSESGEISFSDFDLGETAEKLGLSESAVKSGPNGGMTLQIGANEGQTMNFGIGNMSAEALGVGTGKVDLSTQTKAQKATTIIDNAIKQVSKARGEMGAIQNRLEHTISNLDTASENLQTAESRIRDVDMAEEMVTYSKNNILMQAGQSMLAQANQATQGVLSLLR
ncbi:MAG: flagellin [Lachnospiraceae bacterium]|nr:flagellin [Lachnospiraceae bacterium]